MLLPMPLIGEGVPPPLTVAPVPRGKSLGTAGRPCKGRAEPNLRRNAGKNE